MGNNSSFLSKQTTIKNCFNDKKVKLGKSNLNQANRRITDQELKQLDSSQTEKIQTLGLNANLIGLNGILTITKHKWPNLENLWLQSNHIRTKGCKYLSSALQQMPRLAWLSICNNQIGDEGIIHISKAQFPNLNHLDIGYNRLTQSSIPHLARANFHKLQYISLSHNNFTLQGTLYLLLSSFNQPKQIRLQNNKMGKEEYWRFLIAVRSRFPKYWTSS